MKNRYRTFLLAGLLYSSLTVASPWSCLSGWVEQNSTFLDSNHVSFWHADRWLTEAYSFHRNDPSQHGFCYPDGLPVGAAIEVAALNCGATVTGFCNIKEGLAGHY